MANPFDPAVDDAIAERDATRRQLGELYMERGTLQDVLFDTAKTDMHDMARVRLDEVRDRIPPAEALLQSQENGVALLANLRDQQPREGPMPIERDPNVLPLESPNEEEERQRRHKAHQREILSNLDEVLPNDQSNQSSSIDPLLAGALLVGVIAGGGKTAYELGKDKLGEWQERRTLEPLARAAMGDAMQEQQLDELKSTNEELAKQRQMLVREMAKQELDQPTREAYWKEQFDQEVSKARVVLDSQAPDREGLTLSTDQLPVLQAERHALASGVCEREAAREKVEPLVRLYAESGRATEAQLDGYRQKLRETDAPEIAERTAELHQQYFPDIQPPALDGPGRGGPGDSGPGDSGPGDSGPGGPDRDDR